MVNVPTENRDRVRAQIEQVELRLSQIEGEERRLEDELAREAIAVPPNQKRIDRIEDNRTALQRERERLTFGLKALKENGLAEAKRLDGEAAIRTLTSKLEQLVPDCEMSHAEFARWFELSQGVLPLFKPLFDYMRLYDDARAVARDTGAEHPEAPAIPFPDDTRDRAYSNLATVLPGILSELFRLNRVRGAVNPPVRSVGGDESCAA